MIQRRQSVFLLIAAIISAVCMFMPVGRFVSEKMGADSYLYNIAIKSMDGSMSYAVCIMFVLLLISAVSTIVNILLFKKRKVQMKVCKLNILLLAIWYGLYAYFALTAGGEGSDFRISFAASFPLAAIIFQVLAHIGIHSDEELIRSMDRIR